VPERYDPESIAEELGECRQRGLDWLDKVTSTQRAVRATSLQSLAAEYADASGRLARGRIAQIKILLADGLTEFETQGNMADAHLLRQLFFGDTTDGTIKPPGELLQIARKNTGDTEAKFRQRRSALMRSFAPFLVTFVQSASRPPGGVAAAPEIVSAQLWAPQTGSAADNERFVGLLASAVNATIIGITNERLLPALHAALSRKRASGPPDAFWNSLRIVFLGESLLKLVNDERQEFHDPKEALRQRRLERTLAKRSIGVFLKRTHSTRWTLYDWPYLPILSGSLFELPDGRKVVHLLIRRPRRPGTDYLFIDVEDHVDEFSAVFEDIVHHSDSDTMIVPVGAPSGSDSAFQCNEVRLHARVLKDGSTASGWLPMVIVITSRMRNGRGEAVLQLRTIQNAAREENTLSHLGSHILQEDRVRPSAEITPEVPRSFDLMHWTPLTAAERIVRDATGADPGAALRPMTTGRYLYPDKEHLFFFVFALEVPESMHFPRQAEMHEFRVSELLAIRDSQILAATVRVCRQTDLSPRAFAAAAEVLALNLTLHDHPDLAEMVRGLTDKPIEDREQAATEISELVVARSAPSWIEPSHEVILQGLAGWHYREFFSVLLPLYAELGIDQAAQLCAELDANEGKKAARDRLSELYQDEHVIAVLPLDL
jgi:hypothetical protein